jgi:uncharacterized membrane protein YdjX (TVP38/TMEM64 family)
MWSVALAGLALGSLGMASGTAIGGSVGPLAVGYGVMVAATALYLIVGLAVRDWIGRRSLPQQVERTAPSVNRLAGRRVF